MKGRSYSIYMTKRIELNYTYRLYIQYCEGCKYTDYISVIQVAKLYIYTVFANYA